MEVVSVSLNALLASTKSSLQNSLEVAKGTDVSKITINLPSLPLSHASSGESSERSLPFTVPPTTPAAQFSFSHIISPIVYPFPKLDNFKFPYIRENTAQFWFLDLLTDCLWKLQDEYHFPEHYQKIIIEWILFVLDLIRDPQRNLSRKQFFQIFNEAVCIANEKVQAGCKFLPTPENLLTSLQEGEEEEISFPSQSGQNSSILLTSNGESYVAIGIDENTEIFKLLKPAPKCFKYEYSLDNSWLNENDSKNYLCGCEDSVNFYQPNNDTPERFLSSSSSSSFYSVPDEDGLPSDKPDFLWKRSSFSSEQFSKTCSTQRNYFRTSSSQNLVPHNTIIDEWTNYLDEHNDYIQDLEKNLMINGCALFAIKQFVHDYFYENFQYTVIQLALINNFTSITQNINTQWNVPKVLKEELKKPKLKKERKKKKKKEKKKKKPTKKTKSKQDKRKKKKDKLKRKAKKNAKQKKKKLTKEEKADLLRQRREQERLEEELRRAEENRRMLFPLKEATDDNFFHSIFEHWVKPKQKKKAGSKKSIKKKK
ncbi:reticulocyte-binding protein 2 homolog a-like isoform X2 [Tribolium madens]|uniref:reticulocyte-binding protein 2 homolog a-like isoform X2 n=1 Tax=Tribolium madens TaxID=41895 RepID=UPI001CF73768|nr:reticulocyte-binding protein 2 homolog a-like isoform X2 [Tribolium madens]